MDGDAPPAHIDQRVSPQGRLCAVELHGIGECRRDQLRVDIIRRQEGGQVKQLERFRRFGLKPFEGDLPGGGNRVVEQFAGVAAIEREVFGDRAGGGFDVCPGLLQRQRQVAQGAAQFTGRRGFIAPAALLQELDRLRARQNGELERLGDAAPVRVARGNQDVAGCARRQMIAAIVWVRGVIQDEQPTGMMAQPGAHGCGRGLLVGEVPFRKSQLGGQPGIVGGQRYRFFRAHPPYDVVVGCVAIGVLQRKLSLACAAQSGDRDDGRRTSGGERGAEFLEQSVAAGEVGVAGVWDVPDFGQRVGGARGRWRHLSPLLQAGKQQPPGDRVLVPHEVDVDDLREQPLGLALAHAHRNELALLSGWVASERRGPLRVRKQRREIVGRKHRNGAFGLARGTVHLQHEIRPGPKVGGLNDYRVFGLLQLLGDPLRPIAVGLVVADEKVFQVRLCR